MKNINSNTSKFNVSKDTEKRTCDGIIFDSILEMKFYRDWILPKVESGEVLSFQRQVTYELQPKFKRNDKTILPINYVADFVVKYKSGNEQVIDTKGMPDSVALLKRKMFWFVYPLIDYIWVSYSKIDGGWVEYEKVKQGRKERKKNKQI